METAKIKRLGHKACEVGEDVITLSKIKAKQVERKIAQVNNSRVLLGFWGLSLILMIICLCLCGKMLSFRDQNKEMSLILGGLSSKTVSISDDKMVVYGTTNTAVSTVEAEKFKPEVILSNDEPSCFIINVKGDVSPADEFKIVDYYKSGRSVVLNYVDRSVIKVYYSQKEK